MILGRQLGLQDVVWFVPLVYGGGAYLAWLLYKELRS
jgi:threonine/homoserine/homoserine lactone efflux protein